MSNDGDENDSIDEQDYQLQLERDMFKNRDDEEDEWLESDEEHDGISEHKWTCATNTTTTGAKDGIISITYHLALHIQSRSSSSYHLPNNLGEVLRLSSNNMEWLWSDQDGTS